MHTQKIEMPETCMNTALQTMLLNNQLRVRVRGVCSWRCRKVQRVPA